MKTNTSDALRSLRATSPTTADTTGGALDPAAPRALWRLIQIGETTGLITPADQDAMVEAFGNAEKRRESIEQALNTFQGGTTELYILVTLFAAGSRPVSVPILARETLANSGALHFALERLDAHAAISREISAAGEPTVMLTSSGRGLAVILMYRVFRLVISRRCDRDEMAETIQAKRRRSFHHAPAQPGASTLAIN